MDKPPQIKKNIYPGTLKMPDLRSDQVAAEFNQLYQQIENKALEMIDWYLRDNMSKAKWSRALRLGAILLTTIGGLLPIFQGAIQGNYGQYGYLVLGLAAACVGVDKFFGLSSGWIRDMSTQLSLQKILAEFQIGWILLWVDIEDNKPTPEQQKTLLHYLKDFQAQLFTEIHQETQLWAAEFQSSLIQLEKYAKMRSEMQRANQIDSLKEAHEGAKNRELPVS